MRPLLRLLCYASFWLIVALLLETSPGWAASCMQSAKTLLRRCRNPADIAAVALQQGVDGLIVSNTTISRPGDIADHPVGKEVSWSPSCAWDEMPAEGSSRRCLLARTIRLHHMPLPASLHCRPAASAASPCSRWQQR